MDLPTVPTMPLRDLPVSNDVEPGESVLGGLDGGAFLEKDGEGVLACLPRRVPIDTAPTEEAGNQPSLHLRKNCRKRAGVGG
jgi:hypothetical protein